MTPCQDSCRCSAPVSLDLSPVRPEVPATATGDASNFTAASDTLSLQIDVSQAQGPFTLEVTLLYQTIGYRWAMNLVEEPGAEIESFARMYAALPNLPLTADAVQATITP